MVRDMKRFTTSPVQMAVALTQTLCCPDNGATVDLGTVLSAQIWVLRRRRYGWTLTSTQRIQPHYLLVLENSTCRGPVWDALLAGVAPRKGLQATTQARVWSSAICYQPAQR